MRITITIEDVPTEERPNNLDIKIDFDPPVNDSTESTNAHCLACALIKRIGELCGAQ